MANLRMEGQAVQNLQSMIQEREEAEEVKRSYRPTLSFALILQTGTLRPEEGKNFSQLYKLSSSWLNYGSNRSCLIQNLLDLQQKLPIVFQFPSATFPLL